MLWLVRQDVFSGQKLGQQMPLDFLERSDFYSLPTVWLLLQKKGFLLGNTGSSVSAREDGPGWGPGRATAELSSTSQNLVMLGYLLGFS